MDKRELQLLQAFLRRSFGNEFVKVSPHPKDEERAHVLLGERHIGTLSLDDEDGDRSFAFEMTIPVERGVIQDYLRKLFNTQKLKLAPHGRKTDSVELNSEDQYLGIISSDDAKGGSFTLQIAILDVDLEDMVS